MDLELKGCSYTWTSNPRNREVTKEKLDRVLANLPWLMDFSNVMAIALPVISSDHSSILLHLLPKAKSGQMFNFEAFWAEQEECEMVAKNGWHGCGGDVNVWKQELLK